VALAGEGEGALDLLAVDRLRYVGLVLFDHREQVAEQGALVGRELPRDRVRARRARAARRLADARVTAAIHALLEAVAEDLGLCGVR
jgi:hypothetical protein